MPMGRVIRVLHVLCDLAGGGAERLVLGLCGENLVHQEVVTIHASPCVLRETFRRAGVPVHLGTRQRGTPGLATVLRIARLAGDFDVLHTHLFAGDAWGRPAARLAGKPVVTTEHNVNRDESAARRWIKRGLAPLSDRMVYVSDAAKRHAIQQEYICHPRATVVPNGIALERFDPAARGRGAVAGDEAPTLAAGRPHGNRLLAIGRDVPQKGFDLLVSALPAGATLRIAGASSRRGRQTIAASGGSATVEWLGEREDVPDLLSETDILVVPSRWEGFGLAALEGMAAGVPVVATAVDGLPELLGDVGLLVPGEDPVRLHQALLGLMRDPEERARRGALGLRRAALFSIQRCALQYAHLYAELLDERARR